jgi:hypothetical protein
MTPDRAIRGAAIAPWRVWTSALLMNLILLGNSPRFSLAQESPPPPATAQEEGDAGPPANDAAKPPQLLYIPFRDLKATLNDLNATVMVPLAEYLKLKSGQSESEATKPAGAVITSATYTAVVEKDIARIKAELVINVLGKPWVELPISFGEAAVGKIIGGGENVLLRGQPDGSMALLLGAAGEQKVELELIAKVHTLPDGRQLALATPPVAVTAFDLQLPDAEQTIEIQPKQVAVPVEGGMGTHVRANVGSTATITAKWYPKASRKPAMELLANATNEQIVTIDEGLLHRDAWIRFQILRGQLEQLRIAVPKGNRVLDVSGDTRIRGWKAADEGNRQVITVDLLSPTDQPIELEVHAEGPIPEGTFSAAGISAEGEVFGIHALDVIRENGQVSVRTAPGLALTITDQQGIARADAAQTKERLRADGASAFQYFSPSFSLKAEVKPIQPRLVVGHQSQLVFHEDELRLTAELNYTIERAGVFELRLKLPDNLILDDVQCPAMKEFRVDDTSKTLLITLAQRTQGAINVSIRGHRAFSAATDMTEQTLPLVEPLNVDRELGTIFVFARESIDVITNETGLAGVQPFAAQPGLQNGDARLTSAWSFTRRPVTIPVKTVRKPVRLSADVATAIKVQPQIVEVETIVAFLAEYAGLDTFKVMVPEAISERVQIEAVDSGVAIRQKTPAAAENGWVTWTIVMQREVLGTLRLKFTYDIRDAVAAAQPAAAANAPVAVRVIRPAGAKAIGDVDVPLSRTSGQISISKDDTLSVSSAATGGDVEPIDVRELTLLPQAGASAFRYFKQPADAAIDVTVTRTRSEVQPVVSTVVRRGLIEVVAGDKADAAATFRAQYRIKTSERQRLLVQLPVKLELLGAMVNGREVKLEKAEVPPEQQAKDLWETFWLNVAREGSDDQEFVVALQFLWKLNPALGAAGYGRGSLELPLPIVGPVNAPAAVQELRVAVWTPRDYVLVGEPDDFRRVDRADLWSRLLGKEPRLDETSLESWFGGGSTPFASLPREGRVPFVYSNVGGANRLSVDWWKRTWSTWIASVALAVIALVLIRTSWENKLSMLLFGGFALALYALRDSHAAVELTTAARFGLLFLLLLWTVHGLFGRRNGVRAVATSTTPAPAPAPPPPAPPEGTT